jgi:hypothetical protein
MFSFLLGHSNVYYKDMGNPMPTVFSYLIKPYLGKKKKITHSKHKHYRKFLEFRDFIMKRWLVAIRLMYQHNLKEAPLSISAYIRTFIHVYKQKTHWEMRDFIRSVIGPWLGRVLKSTTPTLPPSATAEQRDIIRRSNFMCQFEHSDLVTSTSCTYDIYVFTQASQERGAPNVYFASLKLEIKHAPQTIKLGGEEHVVYRKIMEVDFNAAGGVTHYWRFRPFQYRGPVGAYWMERVTSYWTHGMHLMTRTGVVQPDGVPLFDPPVIRVPRHAHDSTDFMAFVQGMRAIEHANMGAVHNNYAERASLPRADQPAEIVDNDDTEDDPAYQTTLLAQPAQVIPIAQPAQATLVAQPVQSPGKRDAPESGFDDQ